MENGNVIVLLFEYLVSTRIGHVIAVLISALIIYGIFKLIIKIIDYFVLRRLINKILQTFLEEDETDNHDTVPASNHEDEQSQKKDKKRDQIREAERMQNLENEFIGNSSSVGSRRNQRIVGVAKPIGKWTARVMKQWLQKHQNIDMNLVNDLGYFQALIIAERKAQGLDIGGYGSKKNDGGISM